MILKGKISEVIAIIHDLRIKGNDTIRSICIQEKK